VPFGDVTVSNTLDQTITVENDSGANANLVIGNIAQANPLAAPFSIAADTCSGQTLTPGSACSLTIRFAPTAAGSFTDSFDIPSNDPDENPVTFNVSGNGTETPAPSSGGGGSVGACGGPACGSSGNLGFSFLAILGGMIFLRKKNSRSNH
jgi:hypothetical protein